MRDTKLIVLVLVATILSVAHTADHVARGDLRWPLNVESAPFVLVSAAIYTVLGCGLYLYLQGKVGPRYWAITAAIGVAAGWLGHFSPFTDQPPQYILSAYQSSALGWLALGCLVALMLVLIIGVIYAAYLCGRASHEPTWAA
jgi:hypothetical protein